MRYLSVCSGIEAASVAWEPLGWTPAGFSEVDPFACAVLAHRFPNVKNYGDMTRHQEWDIGTGAIDVCVGGTPCQSFSVAGLRRGLADPRGNLMLAYLALAARARPRWIVWENVPGVLSSAGGRDFGTFLGALGDLGYGWAYRVLDAQWVRTQRHPRAVPQRRRRVFVVGCLGDGTAPGRVLFERESVQRHPAPRREAREGTAADVEDGAGSGGLHESAGTLCAGMHPGCYSGQDAYTGQLIPVAHALRGRSNASMREDSDTYIPVAHALCGEGFDASEDGTGRGTPIVAHAIGTDCYNGAITGDVAATMGTTGSGVNGCGPTVMSFKPGQSAAARTIGASVDVACTLESGGGGNNKQGVAYPLDLRNGGRDPEKHDAQNRQGCGIGHASDPAPTCDRSFVHGVATAMQVRRLTPRECERLQGFPDDWTLVPYRGKPACDGPRYKAIGNSMAVNCMQWIGERIAHHEASQVVEVSRHG